MKTQTQMRTARVNQHGRRQGRTKREWALMEKMETAQGNIYLPPKRSVQTIRNGAPRDQGLWLLARSAARREGWVKVRAEGLLEASTPATQNAFPIGKRVFDAMAATILLFALAPLFLLIGALVMLDSPGSAFFLQERVGERGHRFLLWKFRSMHISAPKYARSPTSADDPRMTRVGRVIRRLSLDELPQLINVLRGEMSLVGPRPEMPFLVEGYTALQRRRLEGRPGITGLWQISEGRLAPIHENLQYDLHYLRHRNVMLDAAILLRTCAVVLSGKETV